MDALFDSVMARATGKAPARCSASPPPPSSRSATRQKAALKRWLADPRPSTSAVRRFAELCATPVPLAGASGDAAGPLLVIENFLPADVAAAALERLRRAPSSVWGESSSRTDGGKREDGAGSTRHRFSVGDGSLGGTGGGYGGRRRRGSGSNDGGGKGHGRGRGSGKDRAAKAAKRSRGAAAVVAGIETAMKMLKPDTPAAFQAGRYTRGCFIEPHDDVAYRDFPGSAGGPPVRHAREIACILYLTREWDDMLGGCFMDLATGVQHVPKFNSVVAFRVPRLHEVTVMNTDRRRFSVFGWFYRRVGAGAGEVGSQAKAAHGNKARKRFQQRGSAGKATQRAGAGAGGGTGAGAGRGGSGHEPRATDSRESAGESPRVGREARKMKKKKRRRSSSAAGVSTGSGDSSKLGAMTGASGAPRVHTGPPPPKKPKTQKKHKKNKKHKWPKSG